MSIKVKANLISKTQLFTLNPVFRNSKGKSLFDLFTTTVLYHGTSSGRMGEQLKAGIFENRDLRIYGDDKETAIRYAIRAAGRDGSKPIVLKISSTVKPIYNQDTSSGWSGLGGLGIYRYFPPGPDQNVKIELAYEVAEHD